MPPPTSQSNLRHTQEYQFGHQVELMIVRELQRHGWYAIPSYDYCGQDEKAPRLQGLGFSYVIPDLDVCKNRVRRWVEVKAKASAAWCRKLQRKQHGFPLRHYLDYCKVRDLTRTEVWVCVYEMDTRFALIQNLAILEHPTNCQIDTSSKMSRGGMFFFARDAMAHWATLEYIA